MIMCYVDWWEIETEHLFSYCIDVGFDDTISEKFLKHFYLNNYKLIVEQCDARKALLVHSNSDYAFSSVDLSWISIYSNVLTYEMDNIKIFFVNLCSSKSNFYLDASAFIKIFNKAFDDNCFYIFRTIDGIAIGSPRVFDQTVKNNHCVTQLFNCYNMDLFFEFWYDFIFTDYDKKSESIIYYSPYEKEEYGSLKVWHSFDESSYEEDQEACKKVEVSHSYKDVIRILENVVNSGDDTSFDTLEEAIYSEQQSSLHRSEDSASEHINDNFVQKYSNEALENAEVLLKEMLEKS